MEPSQHASLFTVNRNVSFEDLPKAWFAALVAGFLSGSERLGLFMASKAFSELVLHHSPCLTLKPAAIIQRDSSSSRRAILLGLAAQCRSIHLHVHEGYRPQDATEISPCITQLTLHGFSTRTISSLQEMQLTALHTIHFMSSEGAGTDTVELCHLLQPDALPSLRRLHFHMYPAETAQASCSLATVFQGRITDLSLAGTYGLSTLSAWPSLRRVEILPEYASPSAPQTELFQQLLSHTHLQHVSMPTAWLHNTPDYSDRSWHLNTLQLTGPPVYMYVLAKLPLHGVKQLRIAGGGLDGYGCSAQDINSALSNLRRCESVQLVPVSWSSVGPYSIWCVPANTPTVCITEIGLDHLMPLLQGTIEPVQAVVFTHNPWRGQAWHQDPSCLSQLPQSIHTVCWQYSQLQGMVNFAEVILHLPRHVRNLAFSNCGLRVAELHSLLSQPAPPGLQQLIVHETASGMPSLSEHMLHHAALARSRWPGVELVFICP